MTQKPPPNPSDSPLKKQLAYAENRDQDPAFLIEGETDDPLAMRFFEEISGNSSYITMADGHTILNILCLLAEAFRQNFEMVPSIAIVGKHGNPCGAAFNFNSPEECLYDALLGNPVAAMGGELVTNFVIDDQLGKCAFETFPYEVGRDKWGIDAILAPGFSSGSIELLGKRAKRRLLANPELIHPIMPTYTEVIKILRGGDKLTQRAPNFVLTLGAVDCWSKKKPLTFNQLCDLLLAWAVTWYSSSNTVALAKNRRLIGLGCGQQDRIECARLCIDRAVRAGHDTTGSVFASDAFFPFATSELPKMEDFISLKKFMGIFQFNDHNSRLALKKLDKLKKKIMILDKREAAELLIDAGCIGGVVPGDGIRLEEVKTLFKDARLQVAFLPPKHRGFSKH